MNSTLIAKLVKQINLDLADRFDLSVVKKLSFVPLDIQKDVFFVAFMGQAKEEIEEYLSTVVQNSVKFIYLDKNDFAALNEMFLKRFSIHKERQQQDMTQNTSEVQNIEKKEETMIQQTQVNEEEVHHQEAEKVSQEPEVNITDKVDTLDMDEEFDLDLDDDGVNPFDISDGSNKTMQDLGVTIQEPTIAPTSSAPANQAKTESETLQTQKTPTPASETSATQAPQKTQQPQKQAPVQDKKDNQKNDKDKDINKVKAPQTKRLGEILIEENLISQEQLGIALAESKAQGIPLGSTLVKMGFVTIKDLKEALGAQMGLGYATEEQLRSLTAAISILPEDFIKLNKVVPLSMTDKSLVVGMVNPNDTKVINEIVYQTGLKPTVMLITHVEFENFINSYFNADKAEADELIKRYSSEAEDDSSVELWDQVEQDIQDSDGVVSQLAQKIISMAIEKRASDIHIEPMSVGYRVRYRIDGSLHEIMKIPAKVDSALISRFKVLSKMNIAEHRRAQDGSFTIKYKNRAQDFRINTLPVAGREKMVIRVLAPQMDSKQAKADKIEIVGASEEDIKKIEYLISSPNGIVLTSGPTGSGKTTTLYSLLRYLNSDDVNITTVEDPVEIKLEGINQSAINNKAGITFANSLRAILRQDPDIVLIGEIRDFETLEVAISASLTGHFVLSTIHTNSSAATITRLIEMGAKDYLISSTVAGIIAQRLVKKLCPNCKEAYYPTEEEARKVSADPKEIEKITKTQLYRAKGCPNCKDTGYLGRLAVLEILVVNKEIKKMIAQHAHDVELEDYAVSQGMKTLRMACLKHILDGNTTIEEQVRILGLAGEQ